LKDEFCASIAEFILLGCVNWFSVLIELIEQ